MKKYITSSLAAILLATTALADTSSISTTTAGMGVLANDFVTAGVNSITGTFGSGGNTSPGLLFDATGTGTFNTSYDYLTPGTPFDGFSVKVDGTNYANNNAGNAAQIAGDGNGLTNGTDTLSWTGGVSGVFDITHTYTLGTTAPYVDISSQITMATSATNLHFGRFIDPDARAAAGDSSQTDNVLGYGVIPDSNVAFSEALSSRYALGLYSTDSNVDAGITMWTTQADSYTENSVDGDGSLTNSGDNTIGLSWHWTSVSAGDILTASYAYIFGPSAFDAANDAITGGAGGGADISSWGTLTNVGSATDAASGSATPTLVSTSSPTISYGSWTSWSTNTSLPVLTQSQTTHDANDDTKIQTIDRETTTVVTTPELRTRSTTTTVVDTYSDSSTITRTTATGTETETRNSAVTTITDPGSFVGRIDQIDTATDALYQTTRGLTYDSVYGIGSNHSFDNAMTGDTRGAIIGGSLKTDNGSVVYGGFISLQTQLSGNGDSVNADIRGLGFGLKTGFELGQLTFDAKYHTVDLSYDRTIGDFANSGITKGSDKSLNIRFEANGDIVNPIIGYTIGSRDLTSFDESGSIQSRLVSLDHSDTYSYGVVGAVIELEPLSITALHSTDGVNEIGLGFETQINQAVLTVDANRTISDLGSSNNLSAGISWKF